jgi:hypothetical protein
MKTPLKCNESKDELIELGTASRETLGTQIPADSEQIGFYPLGLTDE